MYELAVFAKKCEAAPEFGARAHRQTRDLYRLADAALTDNPPRGAAQS